jgi:hypothetical protein
LTTTRDDDVYNFVFRGLLAREALDSSLGVEVASADDEGGEFVLALESLDERFILDARRMSHVYTAIAAFENAVRELISSTLKEEVGENWWLECTSEKIQAQAKQRIEDEDKVRWHAQRGTEPINFTMLPNLLSIIRQNHSHFAALIPDIEWAANVFDVVERSRNVIMHSGQISRRDMARLGTFIRDWAAQVYS